MACRSAPPPSGHRGSHQPGPPGTVERVAPPQAPGGPAPPRYRPARVPVEPLPGRRRIPVAPVAAGRSPPAQPPPGRVSQRVAEPDRQGRAAGAPHRDPPPPRGSRPTPARPARCPPRVPPTGSTEPRAHPGRNRPAAGRNRRLRRRTSSCRPQTAGTSIPTVDPRCPRAIAEDIREKYSTFERPAGFDISGHRYRSVRPDAAGVRRPSAPSSISPLTTPPAGRGQLPAPAPPSLVRRPPARPNPESGRGNG